MEKSIVPYSVILRNLRVIVAMHVPQEHERYQHTAKPLRA